MIELRELSDLFNYFDKDCNFREGTNLDISISSYVA